LKGARTKSGGDRQEALLRRFLHDLSAPLSAVALHLEVAARRASQGKDPSEALATARRELEKTFKMFERGRSELLKDPGGPEAHP
jgi:hypothetical protein